MTDINGLMSTIVTQSLAFFDATDDIEKPLLNEKDILEILNIPDNLKVIKEYCNDSEEMDPYSILSIGIHLGLNIGVRYGIIREATEVIGQTDQIVNTIIESILHGEK